MNSILLLTKLQLVQTFGAVRGAVEKRTGANGAMAGTVLIGAILFVGVAWLGYSAYGLVGTMGLSKALYDILFMTCGALTFTFSLPSILGTFFGSSDINDLLPLPVSPFAIVFAKALSALTTAYLWTFVFIAAPLLGWGIAGTMAGGLNYQYWVVYVLAVVFTPFMPVSYAGTVSIVIATLFKRVRRKDAITTITTVLTLAVSVVSYVVVNRANAGQGVAQMLGSIGESVGSVIMAFPAYGFAVYAFAHPDPLGCWLFVLLSIAAFAVFVVIARVLYMRIVTTLSSGAGKADAYAGAGAQQRTPVFKAMLNVEIRKITRNSSILLYYVVYPLVICPVLFGIMFTTSSMGKLLAMFETVEDATTMFAGFALCGLMALAVLAATSNKIAATSVSREGTNWMYMKFIPVPIAQQVRAKIMPGFAVSAVIALVFMVGGGFFLVSRAGFEPLVVAAGAVLMLGSAWLMTCVGAWSESRNPNVSWGNDGDVNPKAVKGTGGELRAMLVGFVYAALPLLASPITSLDPRVFMPMIAVVGVVAAVVLGRLLLASAARNLEAFE